jgi:hypothetical protein
MRISPLIRLYNPVCDFVKEIGCLFCLVGEDIFINKSIAVHVVFSCDTTCTLKHQMYAIALPTSDGSIYVFLNGVAISVKFLLLR